MSYEEVNKHQIQLLGGVHKRPTASDDVRMPYSRRNSRSFKRAFHCPSVFLEMRNAGGSRPTTKEPMSTEPDWI